MQNPNAPVWFLGDGQNWWGPFSWSYIQANPPAPQVTLVWAQGMAAAQPIAQFYQSMGGASPGMTAPGGFDFAPQGATTATQMTLYRPCPRCRASEGKKVSWTWWGGLVGPAMVTVVKCGRCKTSYNGRTGRSLTGFIAAYFVISMALGLGFGIVAFVAASR